MNEQIPEAERPQNNRFVHFLGRVGREIADASWQLASDVTPDEREALEIESGIQRLEDLANSREPVAKRALQSLGKAARKAAEFWSLYNNGAEVPAELKVNGVTRKRRF